MKGCKIQSTKKTAEKKRLAVKGRDLTRAVMGRDLTRAVMGRDLTRARDMPNTAGRFEWPTVMPCDVTATPR